MAESQSSSPKPAKNFQELVVDSIVAGNLGAFCRCCVTRNDINRRLLPCKELKPMPRYNPEERYFTVSGPTMAMYAILCEQDQILKEILEKKSPDLSITVEGYNVLHLAAMIKDCRCLKLLLECRWIQENINIPVNLFGATPKEDGFTTALHIAVSSRRYANAILLLDDLPKIKNYKTAVNSFAKQEAPKEGEGENDNTQLSSASVNQKSASGSTALYIAVFLNDNKMVDILLAFEADPEIVCSKGKNSIQLAKENQEKNNEQKKRQEEREASNPYKRKVKKEEIDPIDIIVNLLDSDRNEAHGVEACKELYAPELIHKKPIDTNSYDDDNRHRKCEIEIVEDIINSKINDGNELKGDIISSPNDKPVYKEIMQYLKKLNNKINAIEARLESNTPLQNKDAQPLEDDKDIIHAEHRRLDLINVNDCSKCGASGATLCQDCHKYFCNKCCHLSNIHHCVQ